MPSTHHAGKLDWMLRDADVRSIIDGAIFQIWSDGFRISPIAVARFLRTREPDASKAALLAALILHRARSVE